MTTEQPRGVKGQEQKYYDCGELSLKTHTWEHGYGKKAKYVDGNYTDYQPAR